MYALLADSCLYSTLCNTIKTTAVCSIAQEGNLYFSFVIQNAYGSGEVSGRMGKRADSSLFFTASDTLARHWVVSTILNFTYIPCFFPSIHKNTRQKV